MQPDQPMPSSINPNNHPYPTPTSEEKVDRLMDQFNHLMEAFTYANQQTHPHHDTAEAEVDNFLSHHEEDEPIPVKDGKIHLPKSATPQTFDGTMKDTKSFVSSIVLYIRGREPKFHTTEVKIMFVLLFMQGGKAQWW